MNDHLEDDAELYAIGALGAEDAARAERHLASCVACASRVSQAQFVSVSLAASLPSTRPSSGLARRIADSAAASKREALPARRDLRLLATAAAFALALIGFAVTTFALKDRVATDDLAIATLVHGHFKHVTLESLGSPALDAKVLYAVDGSWVYVIAYRPNGTLRAVVMTTSGEVPIGVLQPSGSSASLLARPRDRVRSIVLMRNGEAVARATLAY
jgi:hypothetical protein